MSFLDLPNKIILLISRKQSPCELDSLPRVSRFLAGLLAPALLDSAFLGRLSGYGKRALYSAAKYRNNVGVLHRAVRTESVDAIVTLLQAV